MIRNDIIAVIALPRDNDATSDPAFPNYNRFPAQTPVRNNLTTHSGLIIELRADRQRQGTVLLCHTQSRRVYTHAFVKEYILRILQIKKLPYLSYDLASDEGAKRLWKRKAPPGKQELPGILVGGRFAGVSVPHYIRVNRVPDLIYFPACASSKLPVDIRTIRRSCRIQRTRHLSSA